MRLRQNIKNALAAIALPLILAACGGGGGGGTTHAPVETPETAPVAQEPVIPEPAAPEPGPEIALSFGPTGLDHYPLDARVEKLPAAVGGSGYRVSMVERESEITSREKVLSMFREQIYNTSPYLLTLPLPHFFPERRWITGYRTTPIVRFKSNTSAESRGMTLRVIDHVNAWLPYENHIEVGNDFSEIFDDFSPRTVDGDEVGFAVITASFDEDLGGAAGTGARGAISIAPDFSTDIHVIQHELLHAMGLTGGGTLEGSISEEEYQRIQREGLSSSYTHVPVSEFPESSMSYLSPYDGSHGLSQIDGEMIQAIYTRKDLWDAGYGRDVDDNPRSELFVIGRDRDLSPTDLGSWDDTVTRYSGLLENVRGGFVDQRTHAVLAPTASFGVDWRNGMARPWADGNPRHGTFSDHGLAGSATWSGELVGFTPGREAVRGDAGISVDLVVLTGDAAFTNLEHWAAGEAPGDAGTGALWNAGSMHYDFSVVSWSDEQMNPGYYLRSDTTDGGAEGYISGRFVGEGHEGVIGILERPDLTGAFGAVLED